jgi:hypothetical protein
MADYFEKSPPEEPLRNIRRKRFAALATKQIAGELGERVLVDLALEIDYRF